MAGDDDLLVWKKRKEGEANWRARNSTDDGTYIAYILDKYGTVRIYGVLAPDSQPWSIGDSIEIYVSGDGTGSLAEAKDACQEHHYTVSRAARWAKYMRDNEPPS